MRHVRQESREILRRWFFDDHFDLIAWYKAEDNAEGELVGFQLCYDKPYGEKALTWNSGGSVTHDAVDSGEESPWFNRTPMLTASDGRAEMPRLLAAFQSANEGVPHELTRLVALKIAEYAKRPMPPVSRL